MSEWSNTNGEHLQDSIPQSASPAESDQELMLVTIKENGQERNFLSTRHEFLGRDKELPPGTLCMQESIEGTPDLYRFRAEGQTISARFVSVSVPEKAASCLQAFLSGAWNTSFSGSWHNAPEQTSPNAKALLSQLLRPILDACHAENRWDKPLIAVRWCKAHPEFVKNLDTIFTCLDMLKVERHRRSVTQGEAVVMCCGKELVRYGDDQWLLQKDGKISNGFREKEGRLYGEIIGGYGSDTPDEDFRRAALVQFTDRIARMLEPEKSLLHKIEQAQTQQKHLSSKMEKQAPDKER